MKYPVTLMLKVYHMDFNTILILSSTVRILTFPKRFVMFLEKDKKYSLEFYKLYMGKTKEK